jgi:hypothetical protein
MTNGYDYISERDFDEVWGAHAKPDGDLYSYREINAFPIECVWTVSEGEDLDEAGFNLDNNWYASPGIFVVSALGYLITKKPWQNGTPDAIWYLDDDDRAREERRMELMEDRSNPATD